MTVISPRTRARRPPRPAARQRRVRPAATPAALALALALALAGCGAHAKPAAADIAGVDGGSASASTGAGQAAGSPGTAGPGNPLAARAFRMATPPKTRAEKAAVQALQGYIDASVAMYATDRADAAAFNRYATPDMYQLARAIADKGRNQDHEVTYGAWVFWLRIRAVRGRLAILESCADQRGARDYVLGTTQVKGPTSAPFVLTRYTLTLRLPGGWQVSGRTAKAVGSCPQ